MLDVDGNRLLSYEELRDGMLRLRVFPAIALTEEDFDTITEASKLIELHTFFALRRILSVL